MAVKSIGESSARSNSGEKEGIDLRTGKNMESCDPGEQITLTGWDYCNPISEVFISNSNLTSFHIDNVDFETQIQEIDSEISKFNKCEAHMENTSVGAS